MEIERGQDNHSKLVSTIKLAGGGHPGGHSSALGVAMMLGQPCLAGHDWIHLDLVK